MGVLFDLCAKGRRKRCTECGCILVPDVEADMCEMCVEDRGDTVPDHCKGEFEGC